MQETVDIMATLAEVDFSPSTTYKEILQNVKTILTTTKYSVPLDRNFGLNLTMLDMPVMEAKTRLTGEIVEALRTYEPRVSVESVSYLGNGKTGRLIPNVKVAIKNEL